MQGGPSASSKKLIGSIYFFFRLKESIPNEAWGVGGGEGEGEQAHVVVQFVVCQYCICIP